MISFEKNVPSLLEVSLCIYMFIYMDYGTAFWKLEMFFEERYKVVLMQEQKMKMGI